MMSNLQNIAKKWWQGNIELLLFLPVLLIIYVNIPFSPSLIEWLGVLTLFYLLGITCACLLGARSRGWYMLIGAVVAGVIVVWLWGQSLPDMLTWLLGTMAFYRGFLLWFRRWSDVLPIAVYWVCIFIYFINSAILSKLVLFESYKSLITVTGLLALFVTLWMSNALNLRHINYSKDNKSEVSASIRRHNRVSVISLSLIVLFIALFNILQQVFNSFMKVISDGINYLLSLSGSEEVPLETIPEAPPPQLDLFEPPIEKEPSIWLLILNILGYTVTIIVALILSFIALRALGKLIYTGIQKLITFLKNRGLFSADDQMTGYVDEKQKLITFKELGNMYKDRLQQWLADKLRQEPKWEHMQSNKERVRYLYRNWLLHRIASGFKFKSALTPKETGDKIKATGDDHTELIALYNEARYGHGNISDNDVARLKDKFQHQRH